MGKDASVIIVNYNTKELLEACLCSVYEKTHGLDFDVWVVDNASVDDSCEMLKNEFPQVNLIESKENLGFGGANNLAIEKSDAKYVFLLNSDTLLINNAIKIMFDFMEKTPEAGACGGNLYSKDDRHVHSYGYLPALKSKILKSLLLLWACPSEYKKIKDKGNNENDDFKEVGFITGADLMIRKSVLDKVGKFDRDFFLYFEETELQHRIKSDGNKIFILPDAKIYHLEGASTKKNRKTRRYNFLKGEYLYYTKTNKSASKVFIRIVCMISHLLRLFNAPDMIFKVWRYIWTH